VTKRSDGISVDAATLEQALPGGPDGVAILSEEGRVLWANPYLEGFAADNVSATDLVGRDLSQLGIDPATLSRLLDTTRRENSASQQLRAVSPRKLVSLTIEKAMEAPLFIATFRDRAAQQQQVSELQRRSEEYHIQRELYVIVQNSRSIDELLSAVCASMVEMAELEVQAKTGVFLIDEEQGDLVLAKTHGAFSDAFLAREARIKMGSCLCGRVAKSGTLLISKDCFSDPRHEHHYPNMTAHGHYIVPLKAGGKTLGVLFLYTDPNPNWDEHRLELLRGVGSTVGLAIQRLRHEEALHKLAEQLRVARDEAIDAANAKARFLANMSHELRTPLNAVIGMTDLLKETRLADDQMELVSTAHVAGRALLGVINDILDFSKIEADSLDLEHVSFAPRACIEEVGDIMRLRAAEKGIELVTSVHPNLPARVYGDSARLRQVLINLVGNAVKFTAEGEVVVAARALQATLDSADASEPTITLSFDVRDTGIGIPEESRKKIFSAFSQQDSSITRRFGGTGLGLAITHELVERMGGSIAVRSDVGVGSTFTFTIVVGAVDPSELTHVVPCPNAHVRGMSVVVVEDNASHRMVIAQHLAQLGVQAHLTEDAHGACKALESNINIDMVLIDANMPEVNGFELAERLRAQPRYAKLPLVLMSHLPHHSKNAREQGMGHISKPIKRCTLCKTLAFLKRGNTGEQRSEKALLPLETTDLLRRVLIVDDNPINLKVAGKMVQRLGYRHDVAQNGQEAVEAVRLQTYDVILMDCQMPVLDGVEATRAIRAYEKAHGLRGTAIIALSAATSEQEQRRCKEAGMNHFLAKPLQLSDLRESLSRFCGTATNR
jgi:signal transduction histidine kinase/CheY-like chemotaxis protein